MEARTVDSNVLEHAPLVCAHREKEEWLQEDSVRKEGTAGRRPWVPTCSRGAYIAFCAALNQRSPIAIEILEKSEAGVPGDPPGRCGPLSRSPRSAFGSVRLPRVHHDRRCGVDAGGRCGVHMS